MRSRHPQRHHSSVRSLETQTGARAADAEAMRAEASGLLARAENDARRRLAADLHDGAQQRLVALRIAMGIAEDQLRDDRPDIADLIVRFETQLDAALEDVRAVAAGVYPPLLAARGLGEALRAAARTSGISTTVSDLDTPRLAAHLESAVYYCCLEALQNAAKHAGPHAQVSVRLGMRGPSLLSFEVTDDGAGFDPGQVSTGQGLPNMTARIEAVGGSLRIVAAAGHGVRVVGLVPASSSDAAQADRPLAPDAGLPADLAA